jgi:hypothetical protein
MLVMMMKSYVNALPMTANDLSVTFDTVKCPAMNAAVAF